VDVYLRLLLVSQSREAYRRKSHLVCAGRHDPVAIVANTHALTGFLEVEILQQLHAIGKLGVILQTPKKTLARAPSLLLQGCAPFPPANEPFWQRTGFTAADSVDGDRRVGNLHRGGGPKRCGGDS
jgi:hypothetical protein